MLFMVQNLSKFGHEQGQIFAAILHLNIGFEKGYETA